jgi:hypothetical protein
VFRENYKGVKYEDLPEQVKAYMALRPHERYFLMSSIEWFFSGGKRTSYPDPLVRYRG